MAPEGQARAMAAISSAEAPSGWIHSPGALGTKTSGRPSTQLREWMHFFPSKRMAMLLPRYSCTSSLMRSSAREDTRSSAEEGREERVRLPEDDVERGGELVAVVDLDQADVALVALPGAAEIDV